MHSATRSGAIAHDCRTDNAEAVELVLRNRLPPGRADPPSSEPRLVRRDEAGDDPDAAFDARDTAAATVVRCASVETDIRAIDQQIRAVVDATSDAGAVVREGDLLEREISEVEDATTVLETIPL